MPSRKLSTRARFGPLAWRGPVGPGGRRWRGLGWPGIVSGLGRRGAERPGRSRGNNSPSAKALGVAWARRWPLWRPLRCCSPMGSLPWRRPSPPAWRSEACPDGRPAGRWLRSRPRLGWAWAMGTVDRRTIKPKSPCNQGVQAPLTTAIRAAARSARSRACSGLVPVASTTPMRRWGLASALPNSNTWVSASARASSRPR